MVFHENRLLTYDSHERSYLFFSKIRQDIAKCVVCCSRDWRFKVVSTKRVETFSNYSPNSCFLTKSFIDADREPLSVYHTKNISRTFFEINLRKNITDIEVKRTTTF